MNYFKFSEFDCNCKSCKSTGASGKVNMDADFLERLDFARSIAKGNQSFVITSGLVPMMELIIRGIDAEIDPMSMRTVSLFESKTGNCNNVTMIPTTKKKMKRLPT